MWSHPILKAEDWQGEHIAYGHQKRDGHRLIVFIQPHGGAIALTTSGINLTSTLRNFSWWLPILRGVPPYTSIDGELWYPNKNATYVKTALKKCDLKLQFECFAIPIYEKCLMYFHLLEEIETLATTLGIPFIPWKRIVDDTRESLLQEAINLNIEGWVLKQANYQGWFKLKPIRTIDVIVTGFVEGTGNNLGMIGSLRCSIFCNGKLIEIAKAGGMDLETRVDIDDKDLNRICEIAYQNVGSKGRLRHPRFIQWRDDKTAVRCTTKQDKELEDYWNV